MSNSRDEKLEIGEERPTEPSNSMGAMTLTYEELVSLFGIGNDSNLVMPVKTEAQIKKEAPIDILDSDEGKLAVSNPQPKNLEDKVEKIEKSNPITIDLVSDSESEISNKESTQENKNQEKIIESSDSAAIISNPQIMPQQQEQSTMPTPLLSTNEEPLPPKPPNVLEEESMNTGMNAAKDIKTPTDGKGPSKSQEKNDFFYFAVTVIKNLLEAKDHNYKLFKHEAEETAKLPLFSQRLTKEKKRNWLNLIGQQTSIFAITKKKIQLKSKYVDTLKEIIAGVDSPYQLFELYIKLLAEKNKNLNLSTEEKSLLENKWSTSLRPQSVIKFSELSEELSSEWHQIDVLFFGIILQFLKNKEAESIKCSNHYFFMCSLIWRLPSCDAKGKDPNLMQLNELERFFAAETSIGKLYRSRQLAHKDLLILAEYKLIQVNENEKEENEIRLNDVFYDIIDGKKVLSLPKLFAAQFLLNEDREKFYNNKESFFSVPSLLLFAYIVLKKNLADESTLSDSSKNKNKNKRKIKENKHKKKDYTYIPSSTEGDTTDGEKTADDSEEELELSQPLTKQRRISGEKNDTVLTNAQALTSKVGIFGNNNSNKNKRKNDVGNSQRKKIQKTQDSSSINLSNDDSLRLSNVNPNHNHDENVENKKLAKEIYDKILLGYYHEAVKLSDRFDKSNNVCYLLHQIVSLFAKHGKSNVIEFDKAYHQDTLKFFFDEFLKDKPNLTIPISGKYVPLHQAAKYGFTDLVKALLDKGASVNATDHKGNTPLHKAAKYCKYSCIELLIKYKANHAIKNHADQTPYAYAIAKLRDYQFHNLQAYLPSESIQPPSPARNNPNSKRN